MHKLIPLAIAYDFDGTLAPGNMQEWNFIPAIGMKPKKFWAEVKQLARDHGADEILVYMTLMLERAQAAQVQVRKKDFANFGRDLPLFEGADEWFQQINEYGKASGVNVQHFIVSSGLREMIEGTKIAKHFDAIFASSFRYDHHGVAKWPAMALNYTTKTQYLFRVNKGSLNVYDHSVINKFVPPSERPVPFTNMIYVGDGETDIPCFRLVKDQGGHSIGVYKPHTRGAKARSERLVKDGRVNFVAPANYSVNQPIDRIVKGIIDKLAVDTYLTRLRGKH
jgi:phosphoserine phosphatase